MVSIIMSFVLVVLGGDAEVIALGGDVDVIEVLVGEVDVGVDLGVFRDLGIGVGADVAVGVGVVVLVAVSAFCNLLDFFVFLPFPDFFFFSCCFSAIRR